MSYSERTDPALTNRRTMPKVGGINAKPLIPSTAPSNRRIGTDRNGKIIGRERVSAGSKHNKRFGVKPSGGAVADIWKGKPEMTPVQRLRGVARTYSIEPGAAHGAEVELLRDAVEHAAGIGKDRGYILRECDRLDKAARKANPDLKVTRGQAIREALIG